MPVSARIGPGCDGDEVDGGARDAREHLVGADRVEGGETVVERDRRRSWWMAPRGWWSGCEATAIGGGADAHAAVEGAAHGLDGAEAAAQRAPAPPARPSPPARSARARPAAPRRTRAGVIPTSRRKARAKLRGLMCGAAGQRGHRQVAVEVVDHPALQVAQRLAGGRGLAIWALNWAWPPGRRTNSTSARATASDASCPRSSSTSARARSIPAVTPAEVAIRPSRTKMGSRSTVTRG